MRPLPLLILLSLSVGCMTVDIQEPVNAIYEHNERIVKGLEEIKRATPIESPVARVVDETLWRAADRQRNWTTKLRRLEGRAVVDIPDSSGDRTAIEAENQKLRQFEEKIEIYESVKNGEAQDPLSGVAKLLLGMTGLGGLAGAAGLMRKFHMMRTLAAKWKIAASHMFMTGNKMKDQLTPEQLDTFRKMASENTVTKEMYQRAKAQALQDLSQSQVRENAAIGNTPI